MSKAIIKEQSTRQIEEVMILPIFEVLSRPNVKMLIAPIDYGIYARLLRNAMMLKVRPPVISLLRRSWIHTKNHVINGLIGKCIEIEGALSRVFGGTVMHDRRFLSIIMPRGARWIAE